MDTDRDDLYDDIDFDPIHSATEEQLKILEFFESAELFEIRYLADFCNNLDVSVSVVVDYINVFRNNADYDYEAVISDLSKIGYECDNEFFRIDYTQYFNYRSGTSWAEILDKDFDTWSNSLMFFLSAWMLDNSFKAKNVTETTTYELSKEQKWFCQYHLTHFIRTIIMQRERYDHSRAFFGLPEEVRRWRCRFFC